MAGKDKKIHRKGSGAEGKKMEPAFLVERTSSVPELRRGGAKKKASCSMSGKGTWKGKKKNRLQYPMKGQGEKKIPCGFAVK